MICKKKTVLLLGIFLCYMYSTLFAQHVFHKDSIHLQTYQNESFEWESITSEKAIFIINSTPQCSSCEEYIYQYFNTLDLENCNLFVVYNNVEDYVRRTDLQRRTKRMLSQNYIVLYTQSLQDNVLENYRNYPQIILYTKRDELCQLLEYAHLFSSSILNPDFRRSVQKRIRRFVR